MQNDCFPEATSEWRKRPISALAVQNPRYPIKKGEECPFVEMASVGENFGGILKFDRRKPEGSGLTRFRESDTLFAKITPCPENGKIAFVEKLPAETGLGSTEFIVLSPTEETCPRFLYHLVCSHSVRGRAVSRMEGSTGRQRIPEDVFDRRLLVPIPNPMDQIAIADFLDALDKAISSTNFNFLHAIKFKTELINHLVFHGIKGEARRRTEAGLVAGSWSCKHLGDYIIDGPTNGIYRPESDYGEHGTPIVRIDSFDDGQIHSINNLRRVNVGEPIPYRYGLRESDVLINRVNSLSHIGKSAIVPPLAGPTLFESNMMRLQCGDGLRPEFLVLILCSDVARRHWLSRAKPAVNQASINQRDVRELPVPIPSDDEEQATIIQIVAQARTYVDMLKDVLFSQQVLRKSLMHDLLTGKVRVSPKLFEEEALV